MFFVRTCPVRIKNIVNIPAGSEHPCPMIPDCPVQILPDCLFKSSGIRKKEMKLIPPVRITRNRIMNRIPKAFPDREDTCRYPLTAYSMNTCSESVENFYMRRLRYAIHYFLDEGSHPHYSKVIVKSGITWAKIDVYRDRINRMIDDALAENLWKDRGNLNTPSL